MNGYVCIYIYHIFSIHFSINEHLGCFRVLAIVNSTAVNFEMCLSFRSMASQSQHNINYTLI